MDIRYPILLIIIPLIIIGYLLLVKNKNNNTEKKSKSKIANTYLIKNTDYYKSILRKYKLYKYILLSSFIVAILSGTLLISRLSKVEVNKTNEYKRDIILCMDVSASVDELNLELVKNLKETVKSLKGERFGISIFNTSSVIISPLTEDYEFILERLDEIEKSIKANNSILYGSYSGDNYFYTINYIFSGTIEDNETRGSSLIGDGLASCIYSFPKLEDEDRSRIIIFSTDNDLAGTPLVTLDKATQLGKKKNIKLFGIGTSAMKESDKKEFKNAIENANGKFYIHSNSNTKNIVKDIEKTSKTLIEGKIEKKQIDLPTIPFIILLLSTTLIIIISKKVIS